MPIDYYRVVDQQIVVIGTITGAGAWTRVTGVTETPSTVTITVSSLLAPLPGSAAGNGLEFVLKLREPIAGRAVVDGSSGLRVRWTRCLPPVFLGPGCT